MSFEILKSQVHVLWEIAQHEPRSHIAFLSHAHYRAQYDNEGCRAKLFTWTVEDNLVYYDRINGSSLCPEMQTTGPGLFNLWVYDKKVLIRYEVSRHISDNSIAFVNKHVKTHKPKKYMYNSYVSGTTIAEAKMWFDIYEAVRQFKRPPSFARTAWLETLASVKQHLELEAARQNSST